MTASAIPSPETVWDTVEAGLSRDPRTGMNTAVEACGRHARGPARLALIVHDGAGGSQRWTYQDLDRLAARAARVFHRAGLRAGDRVAAVLSRQVESLIVALAAWGSGLVYVPLFSGFGPDALAHRLGAAGVRLVVVGHPWRRTLGQAADRLAGDLTVLTVAGDRGEGLWSGDRSFWAELDAVDGEGPAATTAASDAATLMFTSGTVAGPKACVIPHGGLLSLVPFARAALGLDSDSLVFTTADPAWSYGLYTTGVVPMALGVPRVMYGGDFDPQGWHRVMVEEQVTCLTGAPAAYRRLAEALTAGGVPPALRTVSAAGEPLSAALARTWADTGAPAIHDGYGLTEMGMVLGDLVAPETGTVPGSMAGPIPGFEVRLVDAHGEDVPVGDEGRIAVRRPRYQLSVGYENRPEDWQRRWVGDLFVTEDLARQEPDGRWRFVGRADDIIVTTGHNVSPVEVETVLLEHPGVLEAAAVAAPDPERGTVVRAVVVPGPDASPREALAEELRDAVARRVARYAMPRIIDFADSLPRTEVGKFRRAALRASPPG